MKDGSMFQHFKKVLDEDFLKEHQTFVYDSYAAEISSVYNTLTDFNYIQANFSEDEKHGELLEKMKGKSKF